MINKRIGIYETNSSSEHAVSVRYKDLEFERYIDDNDCEFVMSDSEMHELLRSLPLEVLEEEIKERRELQETVKKIPTEILRAELERRVGK